MTIAHQLEVLQFVAIFAASLRGHQLNVWLIRKGSATAACTKCGRGVTVYPSLLRPYMDGVDLAAKCGDQAALRKAA